MIRCRAVFFNSYPLGATDDGDLRDGGTARADGVVVETAGAAGVDETAGADGVLDAPIRPRRSSFAAPARSNASELCGSDEVNA